MKLKVLLVAVVATVVILAQSVATYAAEGSGITVSAAISLKNAFEEIAKGYKAGTGRSVIFNFGASGDLMRQIVGGAPVDVFASAAKKDMDDAEARGMILSDSRRNFALNSIVLIVPAQSGLKLKSFRDLKGSDITKIAVGNPKTVPAGRYAKETLVYYGLWETLGDKYVLSENVRQALDYVSRAEVDAGIVYATDAAVKKKDVIVVLTAPEESHSPVVYPMAVVAGSKDEAAARAFIKYVMSPQGRKVLRKYGFGAAK
jgi:molybdate transport system substrate-binding protein